MKQGWVPKQVSAPFYFSLASVDGGKKFEIAGRPAAGGAPLSIENAEDKL